MKGSHRIVRLTSGTMPLRGRSSTRLPSLRHRPTCRTTRRPPTSTAGARSRAEPGDVTARRNAEVALADSERRYRLLFENALDAILVGDDAGRLVEANPAACDLLGMSRDDILNCSMSDVVIDRWSSMSIGQEWDEFVLRRP